MIDELMENIAYKDRTIAQLIDEKMTLIADYLAHERLIAGQKAELTRLRAELATKEEALKGAEREIGYMKGQRKVLKDKINDIAGDAAKSLVDATAQDDENKRLRAANAALVEALKAGLELMPLGTAKRADWLVKAGNIISLSRAEQAKPELADPSARQTLRAMLECCRTWSPDACVLVNITAGQIVAALESVLAQGQAKPETCVWTVCPGCGRRIEVKV